MQVVPADRKPALRSLPPTFWQHLLAAELTPHKVESVLATVRSTSLDPLTVLRTFPGLTPGEKLRLSRADMRALDRVRADNVHLLTGEQLPNPASEFFAALFVQGDPELLNLPRVGIVGTRNCSTYGKAVARKFAQALSEAGCLVVSGGALGIDAEAHEGALAGGGKTAIVVGSGVDVVYPAVHRPLFERVVQSGGLLISQFAAGTKPASYRFLWRNRLVAALSQVLLVVEAPQRSGALSTASIAAELGQHVCVVPGSITHSGFRGSHGLIRDGAILVDHPDQVLEMLGLERQSNAAPAGDLTQVQQTILESLSDEPITPEKISEATGLEVVEILAELTDLEVYGWILRDGIGYAKAP